MFSKVFIGKESYISVSLFFGQKRKGLSLKEPINYVVTQRKSGFLGRGWLQNINQI